MVKMEKVTCTGTRLTIVLLLILSQSIARDIKCYNCLYYEGDLSNSDGAADSDPKCKTKKSLNNDLLQDCGNASSSIHSEFTCGKLVTEGRHNDKKLTMIYRGCTPYFEMTKDHCAEGTVGELVTSDHEWSQKLQNFLKDYHLSDSLSATACICTGDKCNSAISLSSSQLNFTLAISISFIIHFLRYRYC